MKKVIFFNNYKLRVIYETLGYIELSNNEIDISINEIEV